MHESLPQPPRRRGVVVAIHRPHDDRWLMVRRAATLERAPLKVGFPGGEIDPGESQQQAIVREMMEELGITVEPLQCLWEIDLPDRPWTLYGWTARHLGGDIRPAESEIAEVLWLSADEGENHPDGLNTNKLFIPLIRQSLARFPNAT